VLFLDFNFIKSMSVQSPVKVIVFPAIFGNNVLIEEVYMENQSTAPPVKSSFVNVFAWLMIVFNGFGLFMSIIQNIIFVFVFKMDEFRNAFNDMGDIPKGIPALSYHQTLAS
jgi:hypothetical protein